MSKVYIGCDNGVTGTIGVVGDYIQPQIFHTPVKKEQDFTKAKNLISRLDCDGFMSIFNQFNKNDIHVVCERPMINPTRWKASMSAIRCWEAQLIILEVLGVPHQFIDSKEWQKELLPKGIKGADEQKKASKDIGKRLFPQLADFKHRWIAVRPCKNKLKDLECAGCHKQGYVIETGELFDFDEE